MIYFIKYHLPVIILLIVIFVLSSIPGNSLPEVAFKINDKLLHGLLYFILYFLFHLSFSHIKFSRFIRDNAFLFSFLFTVLYAASDEFHQMYVPNRSSDLNDLIADSFGGLLAFMIAKFILFLRTKKVIKSAGGYDTN